jgi:hypothetical protein
VARRSAIRASDADRDSVVERLRHAAVEGRLAAHELEHRVSLALKAKTYGELDETVADLPSERSGRPRSPSGRALATARAHPVLVVAALPILIAVVAAVIVVMIVLAMAWATVMLVMLVLMHNRRGRGHGPWGPRGPWVYYGYRHRQLRSSRQGAPGGFIPWL